METFPIGRDLLIEAANSAADTGRGVVWMDKMVTLVITDGKLTVEPFKLSDVGDDEAQYDFLHDVLLNECPVKEFTDWTHMEKAGKGRYREGTGYGWRFLTSVLTKYGVADDAAADKLLECMIADGKVKNLGVFQNSCAGGNFSMYAAV